MSDPLQNLLPPLDDAEGPAKRIADSDADALVMGALALWEPAPPVIDASAPASSGSLGGWAAIVGGVAIMGVIGAAIGWAASDEPEPPPPAPVESSAEPAPAVPFEEPEPEPEAPPIELVEPFMVAARRERPRANRRAVEATPDDLLREANLARGAGRYREAERVYLEVTSAYPGTRAAYTARIAAAGLRLDHLRNPSGAVRLYRAALRSRGPLDADARHGLARAFRVLGNAPQEERALDALVTRHPGSPFARAAERRLEELRGP